MTQERQRRRLIRKWEWWWWQGREEAKERKVWQQVSFLWSQNCSNLALLLKHFRSASPSPIRKRKDKKRSRSRDRRSRSRGSKSRRSGRRSRSRSRSRGERRSKRSRSRGSRRWTNEEDEWGNPQLQEKAFEYHRVAYTNSNSSSSLKLMLNFIHRLIKWSLFRFPWIRNKLLILKWKIATVSVLNKIPRPFFTITLLCHHEKQYLLIWSKRYQDNLLEYISWKANTTA